MNKPQFPPNNDSKPVPVVEDKPIRTSYTSAFEETPLASKKEQIPEASKPVSQ
jgi:hypothetical protein